MVLLSLLEKMENETTDIKGLTIHKLLKNEEKKLSFLSLKLRISQRQSVGENTCKSYTKKALLSEIYEELQQLKTGRNPIKNNYPK